MRHHRRVWLALAATLALLPTACERPRPIQARPALWRVADDDTTIWLLGTIHALPPGVAWETPKVKAAMAQADTLVQEIPAGDHGGAITTASGLPPLTDRVPAPLRSALKQALREAQIEPTALDDTKTWAAALAIGNAAIQRAGAGNENGVDTALAARFGAAGKRRLAFETTASQLAIFDALPEDAQRVLLRQAIGHGDYKRTLRAWAAGDEAALAASNTASFRAAPALEEMLVTRRNARWSGWIARRMGLPGRVLVAVGAGHLVGPRSVIAMLRAGGLQVARVQ